MRLFLHDRDKLLAFIRLGKQQDNLEMNFFFSRFTVKTELDGNNQTTQQEHLVDTFVFFFPQKNQLTNNFFQKCVIYWLY
jgi:hypothetical protein